MDIMAEYQTKRCTKCGEVKPVSEFYKRAESRDGLVSNCKSCGAAATKRWRENNADKDRARKYAWREKNKERAREIDRKSYQKRREVRKAKNREYNRTHREERREYQRNYYHQVLRPKVSYNVSKRIAAGMRFSLKDGVANGGAHWEDLVGYNYSQLERRLKKTMPKSYSWDDFLSGDLHIDHIRPIASFNITSADCFDFKQCWALDNLRLLPASQNRLKKDNLLAPVPVSLPGV
ncbi:putative prophage protein [Pseudodesulfovibrio profundus]|uniref:Putative prophage protein n=1 Tax=Pseudodesulfovibrio profundus TaxID=57320 RepID=A0A2C8FDL6_9BACT|nr:hypothetical protein [Pseudodesulfovibrio profundus]SOB60630.1 putative prophage protein [Pseudodesulfovibrio profundus]